MVLDDEDWITIGMDAYGLPRAGVTTTRMTGRRRWTMRVDGDVIADIDSYEHDKIVELLDALVLDDQTVTFEQTQFEGEKEELRDPSYWLPVEGMDYAVSGKNYIRVFAKRTLTSRQQPENKFTEDDDKVGKIFTVIKRALAKKLALTDDVDDLNFRTGCELTRVLESKKVCPVTWKV